jgi:outer membrane protein OmpA-like peptidoglycan-associated protein
MQMYKDNDPAVTEQGGKIANTLYYNHNQTNITEADKVELEKFVRFFKEHPNMKMIKLNAYGDATGTDEANMEVTQKRAKAVMEYLQKRGIPADRLKLNPLGKSLKFKNKYSVPDPKLNRKVDIEVVE